jgi:prefoldin subunit 5
MGWLAKELVKVPAENIHFYTIPIASAGSYVYLDSEEALELINDKISDLSRVITAENVIHLTP